MTEGRDEEVHQQVQGQPGSQLAGAQQMSLNQCQLSELSVCEAVPVLP